MINETAPVVHSNKPEPAQRTETFMNGFEPMSQENSTLTFTASWK